MVFNCAGRPDASVVPFQNNEMKFKSLDQTYKIYTFLLALGMMYPNPKTDRKRQVVVVIVSLFCLPMVLIIARDMSLRIQKDDMPNLVRQVLMFVALVFILIKSYLTVIHKKNLREIFDSINEDYDNFNYLPEDYQMLVEDTVKKTKFLQTAWTFIMGISCLSFPLSALFFNVYSYFFSETPRRFMLHEFSVWGLTEEQQYTSPFYEIVFTYSLFVAFFIFVGFIGFDGMFSVCIFHVSLKIKLYSHKLQHLCADRSDLAKIRSRIAEIVEDQRTVEKLICKVKESYEIWMALIFFISVIQIAMALSQTTSSGGGSGQPIFFMFVGATATHIFLPCYLTSDVTYTAAQVADSVYNSSWENVTDVDIRRSIVFMIARAQMPTTFKAARILTFNMEMFVSVMQTGYSMFTLLRD